MPPLRIYVAAPYTADTPEGTLANTLRAVDAGLALFRKGHYPYIPHLTHWVDGRAKELGVPMRWEDYIRWDDAWLRQCDAFLYLAASRGADLELAKAEWLGLPVYRSVDEVPDAGVTG